MPTPANRAKIQLVRGSYSNIAASLSDLVDGELCYAKDENRLYMVEGSTLTQIEADPEDIESLIASIIAGGTGIDVTHDDSSDTVTIDLADTAVTAGSYGSASSIPTFTVDQQGRITAASENAINTDVVLIQVHNQTASDIVKGKPVYVSGTHSSGKPTVALADNDGSNTYPAIGLVYETITSGTDGYVIISGLLTNIATSTLGNAGDPVYIDSTPGDLTTTRPTASTEKVQKVGLITRSHATNGTILIIGAGRTNDINNELVALTGVNLNDSDLGTFTGTTITDNSSIKTALQELETKTETPIDTADIVDDAVTADKLADTSVTAGSYTAVDITVDAQGRITAASSNTIPTNNNQLTNGAGYATTSYVDTEVAALVDSAPGTLDTLNELAAALGDDANFSTTVSNSIASKLPLAGGQMTGNITFSGTQTVDGRDLSVDGAKLDNIAAGAEVNTVDSVNTQTGAVVLDADDIDDTSTTNKFTTTADITKLAGIETAATADQTGAEIKAAYESEANTNAYTDAEKTKLAGIAAGAEVNVDTDLSYTASTRVLASSTGTDATLPEVVAAGNSGLMTGADKTKLDGIESGATGDQTGAEIKTAYEAQSNTNAFTDSEKTKLAGIESGATADQTASEIKTAYESNTNTNAFTDAEKTKLSGIETSADVTDATNVAAAGAVMESDTSTINMSFVVDEDTMVSNSATKVPTQQSVKAYVDAEVAGVVDAAPAALDTLNELAAALGDDPNFATTVTNSIGTKLPLAGGTMTGNIAMSGSQTVDGRDLSVDGAKLDGIESGATADQTASEILAAIKTVDGTGSGLDADTVDGVQASSFLRSDAADTATGDITIAKSTGPTFTVKTTAGSSYDALIKIGGARTGSSTSDISKVSFTNETSSAYTLGEISAMDPSADHASGNGKLVFRTSSGGTLSDKLVIPHTGSPTYDGNTLWHAGNDGSGSGLDADLLDGQQGSYYLNTSTSFGGDVSGTYNAIVVANDSHSHAFNNLTGKTSGTGDYSTNGDLVSGRGSGGVALTVNDGKGNANVTFNHQNGTPEQNGNAARIEVNTDATSGATIWFEGKSNVTGGTNVNLDNWFTMSSTGATCLGNEVWHAGNDGAGSGLDADLLDGQQGSYYLNTSSTIDGGTY